MAYLAGIGEPHPGPLLPGEGTGAERVAGNNTHPGQQLIAPRPAGRGDQGEGADLFFHAIATLHAPVYRSENAGALRQDWPRIPLPASSALLRASAALGQQVAALLDPETPVAGVTRSDLLPALLPLARLRRADGSSVQPQAGDLTLTAGWGHAGRGGIVMPARARDRARLHGRRTGSAGRGNRVAGRTNL